MSLQDVCSLKVFVCFEFSEFSLPAPCHWRTEIILTNIQMACSLKFCHLVASLYTKWVFSWCYFEEVLGHFERPVLCLAIDNGMVWQLWLLMLKLSVLLLMLWWWLLLRLFSQVYTQQPWTEPLSISPELVLMRHWSRMGMELRCHHQPSCHPLGHLTEFSLETHQPC